MKKIKVVHIVEGFIGGLASYMSHVLPRLCDQGFDITLICSLSRREHGMAEKLEKLRKRGVDIHYIPMQRGFSPFMDLYCFVALYKLLEKNHYDMIHTHCSKAGFLGRLAAVLSGISTRLHSSHCFAYLRCKNFLLRRLYYWIERLLSKITTQYIAVSPSEAQNAFHAGIFPEVRCRLVENGIPFENKGLELIHAEYLKTQLGIQADAYVITTGCRFIGYKGLELLLKAISYVNSNCRVIIAGEGQDFHKLEQYIVRNNLQDKVLLITPTVEMSGLLQISDIAILCSDIEAQPYFLLEAMRADCPIIATDVPGSRELLEKGRGVLVQPDPKIIAGMIDKLCTDSSLRKYYSDSAYQYAVKNHYVEKQINQLSRVYLNVMKKDSELEKDRDVRSNLQRKAV